MSEKKRILFVCVENSNRSQLAEAFARIHGGNNVEAYSAGSRPSGKINARAIEAMRELGYDLTKHASLNDIPDVQFDLVTTMGCGDECLWVKAKIREDWDIPDPKRTRLGRHLRYVLAPFVAEILPLIEMRLHQCHGPSERHVHETFAG